MNINELEHRLDIGLVLNEMGLTNGAIEIGVAYGENAKMILDKWEGTPLYLVDPYIRWKKDEYIDGSSTIDFEGALGYAKNLLKEHENRIKWVRETSDDAVKLLPVVDFEYVDGNHHQPQIGRDLGNYWNLVRPGGIFGGHDFYNANEDYYRCEVKDVVTEFAKKRDLKLHITPECTSWWIVKPC